MLGPEPDTMGFVKNLFRGHFREELVFPFPEITPEETTRCDDMLAELDDMAAWCHAMDATLYMTTGQLDRDDDDDE